VTVSDPQGKQKLELDLAGVMRSAETRRLDRAKVAGAMTVLCDNSGTNRVHPFEVFTGAGKRRN
jgi:hypothetical protein